MAIKMTFTLDEDTVVRLETVAELLRKPKSRVVRDAVREYSERVGRLSDDEQKRLLKAFDRLVPAIPQRSTDEAKEELAALRRARRGGGRVSPSGDQ